MELLQKEALKIVGIRVEAGWQELGIEMPKAWKEIFARQAEIKNRLNDNFMDVCLQEEGGIYTQLVGVEVRDFENIPDDMIALEVPAQEYIYHNHAGDVTTIASSFGAMYDWARQNGISADEFKLDIGYTPTGLELEHSLFVKVIR